MEKYGKEQKRKTLEKVRDENAPSRGYKELESDHAKKLIEGLKAKQYSHLKRGQIPSFIQRNKTLDEAWYRMMEKAGNMLQKGTCV